MLLKEGSLTVVANNSELSQILRSIAKASGMSVDGEIVTSRVFGTYGPGSPRDVLTALLTGSGYSFVMSGVTQGGAPRALTLTPEKTASPPSAYAAAKRDEAAERERREQEGVNAGALTHVPPPPPEDRDERMQRNLKRLQQRHDQMTQQGQRQ